MNKKFLAIIILFSALPGCLPRYQCLAPVEKTCVVETKVCQDAQGNTTCYEEYPATEGEVCYEAQDNGAGRVDHNYNVQEFADFDETQESLEDMNYADDSLIDEEFEEFDYDEFED